MPEPAGASDPEELARGARVLSWVALGLVVPVVLLSAVLAVAGWDAGQETEGLLLVVLLLWLVPAAGAAAIAGIALRVRGRRPRLAVGMAIGALIVALMDLVSFTGFWLFPA